MNWVCFLTLGVGGMCCVAWWNMQWLEPPGVCGVALRELFVLLEPPFPIYSTRWCFMGSHTCWQL